MQIQSFENSFSTYNCWVAKIGSIFWTIVRHRHFLVAIIDHSFCQALGCCCNPKIGIEFAKENRVAAAQGLVVDGVKLFLREEIGNGVSFDTDLTPSDKLRISMLTEVVA